MSLIINNNTNSGSFDINQKNQDLITKLPKDLVSEIFSYLSLKTLGKICCLSKDCQQLLNDPSLWKIAIYTEIAFGSNKWAETVGDDMVKDEDEREEFNSLPVREFIEDCKKFKRKFPDIYVRDYLMLVRVPKTLNGQLTINNLYKLAKKFFPNDKGIFKFFPSDLRSHLEDNTVDKSRWVIMTKDVLPGSKNIGYAEKKQMVDELTKGTFTGYEISKTLESLTCIFSQYLFDPKKCLFGTEPMSYIICADRFQDANIVIGGLNNRGLYVTYAKTDEQGFEDYGTALMRKF